MNLDKFTIKWIISFTLLSIISFMTKLTNTTNPSFPVCFITVYDYLCSWRFSHLFYLHVESLHTGVLGHMSSFSNSYWWLGISHGRNIYTIEIGKRYPSGFAYCFGDHLDLRKWWWKRLQYRLNLKMYCVSSHYIVNSTKRSWTFSSSIKSCYSIEQKEFSM